MNILVLEAVCCLMLLGMELWSQLKNFKLIFATFVYTLFQIEIIKTSSLEKTSHIAKSHL